jgi:catechol 2,3-dioxygenase-like lactoylglutathione lyase family enzyme
MVSGGNVTLYVSNMDAAVRFYTQNLGLRLTHRFGDHWATIDAGPSYWTTDRGAAGLTIGLHPASAKHPAPGTPGAVGFGFETYTPIDSVVSRLAERGVRVSGEIVRFEAGNSGGFSDLDGTPTYVHEFPPEMVPPTDLAAHEDATEHPSRALLGGGHALVYVSNMDVAVRFYVDTLGLELTNRYGDRFATVEAGHNLLIALHPRSPRAPAPGTKGSAMLGLSIDEPIARVVARLAERGARLTSDIIRTGQDSFVEIEDVDGNPIYLWEAANAPQEDALALTAKGRI